MSNTELHGVSGISGSNETPLDLTNLPPSPTVRWVMSRKVEVLAAVRRGLLSSDDACKRYAISMDELIAWKSAMDHFGPSGLRATNRSRTMASHMSRVDTDITLHRPLRCRPK